MQDVKDSEARRGHETYARQRLEKLKSRLMDASSVKSSDGGSGSGADNFAQRMRTLVENMPTSHGGRYYQRFNVRIGIVCDEFLWDSWKDAADFVYISPDQDPVVVLRGLDCLVVASTWCGLKNNEWRYMYHAGSPANIKINEFISAAKRMGIRVVFYSKEDPPNYNWFVGIAKKADTIFTSSAEMIPRYKTDCGIDDVHSLNFCINPICHNPVGTRFAEKSKGVVFSGSWTARYPKRCEDLAAMFDGVLLSGRKLTIIDRNWARRNEWRFAFPPEYQPYLKPAVDRDRLRKIHKLYDWALNINSVQDSATMFANRVYELQAAGNLLLSNYSVGMAKDHPSVFLATSRSHVGEILGSLSAEEIYERQMSGVRRVMTGETCYDRIAQLLNAIGIKASPTVRNVLVVANAADAKLAAQFSEQTYPSKRLVDVTKLTDEDWQWADIVAFFDPSCDYGAFYLEDMANAFKYVDCNFITKSAFVEDGKLNAGPEHTYVSRMGDKCRTVFWRSSYERKDLLSMTGPQDLPGGYAIDHFNFSKGSRADVNSERRRPKLSVIVPLHNDGWALYGRLFPSLRRADIFSDAEVVIVDAGSDDGRSPQIAAHLAETHENVRLVKSNDKPGNLDAARDFGVTQASAPYIVFADPEVEVDGRGLAVCFGRINSGNGLEIVIGNEEEFGGSHKVHDNFSAINSFVEGADSSALGDGCTKAVANWGEECSKFDGSISGGANVLYRKDFIVRNSLTHGGGTAFVEKAMNASSKLEAVSIVACRSVCCSDSIADSDKPRAEHAPEVKVAKQLDDKTKTAVDPTKSASEELPKGDEGFFERISARIAGMPESNGSRYYGKLDSKIGIICDQFYWDSICSAADFKYISPSVTEEELSKLDCMLVVSTWTGLKNEEWRGISTEHRPMRIRAEEIIDICRKRNVPTIFYSKEDPPNYDLYVGLAQKCDFVFTSAAECIPDYKRDCGHDRVYAMKFCINPTVHNPVGMRHAAKERNVIFSGSWMEKYPHRCKDLDTIFTGILQSGRELNIVDRNYALRGNPMYRYPEKYRKFQSPAIDHASLMKVHKLFDWAVNINTVKDSATMFANRVYELQASGNLLLSNYSVGVSNLLPTVFLVHESDEAARMLANFTDEEVYERQTSGVRRVMSGETCYERISEMLSLAGIGKEVPRRRVLVIVDKMSDKVRSMFDRQSYEDKEILEVSQVTDQIYADADIIAFFREDYEYGVFYLEDMVNGFKYTDCDYITKDAYLKNGKIKKGVEHAYVDVMRDKYRTVFWRKSFDRKRLIMAHGEMKLPNGYSIDHFNVDVKPRHVERTKPEVSVIIPTYNNGWFLYGRSFASLRRSSIFDKMEVIIVDDGSPDGFTPKMGLHLESLYPNVRTFHFPIGGSGTAARPRNKGLSLAVGSYVMFIDPDDAAIDDGFAKLYKKAKADPALDVVYGGIIKFVGDEGIIERVRGKQQEQTGIDNTLPLRQLLESNFMPVNTMAMVLSNAFIQKHNLRQTEGGMGEDSLFSQQVFALAGKSRYEPVLTLFYYAERTDSVCNTIDPVFFDKYILTERDRVGWLNRVGLFQAYVRQRLAPYVVGWYFKKLGMVAPENREACCRKLMEILSLYGSGNPSGDQKIGKFIDAVTKGDVDVLFGTVIPLPAIKSSGKRVEILPQVPAFCLPLDKKVVRYTCPVEKKSMVYVSGAIECAGIQSDLEKSSLMCVLFEDSSKKPLLADGLSHSPKFGDYIYLTAGAGAARGFRRPIRVPDAAVRLTIAFVRWVAKNELRVSDLKVTAQEA